MKIGCWISIRRPGGIEQRFAHLQQAGFTCVQAHFPDGCSPRLARAISSASRQTGIEIAAVSGYANFLRPETAPMGSTVANLKDLIELTELIQTHRVVTWSGAYGEGLWDPHPDNQSPVAWSALYEGVLGLLPVLEKVGTNLVFEPFYTQVLSDEDRILRFLDRFDSPRLSIVLDPPNLIAPDQWPTRTTRIQTMVERLAPSTGLVHLKDVLIDAGQIAYPGPGEGILDYPSFLGAVVAGQLTAPWIIEHVPENRMGEALKFVLTVLQELA